MLLDSVGLLDSVFEGFLRGFLVVQRGFVGGRIYDGMDLVSVLIHLCIRIRVGVGPTIDNMSVDIFFAHFDARFDACFSFRRVATRIGARLTL